MRILSKSLALTLIAPIAACTSSSEDEGIETIISNGLLDLELPAPAERDALSPDVRETVDVAEFVNENIAIDTSPGTSTYNGSFAIGFDDGDEIVSGTTEVDVGLNASTVEYEFTVTTIENSSDFSTVSGVLSGSTSINAGYYNGGLMGVVTADTTLFDVSGIVSGVFAQGGETIGQIEGSIIEQGGSESEGLLGVFVADD